MKVRKSRLLYEFRERSGDYNVGGTTRAKLMTAYREKALRVAGALAGAPEGGLSPAHLREKSGVPNAAAILQNNYYGWHRRSGALCRHPGNGGIQFARSCGNGHAGARLTPQKDLAARRKFADRFADQIHPQQQLVTAGMGEIQPNPAASPPVRVAQRAGEKSGTLTQCAFQEGQTVQPIRQLEPDKHPPLRDDVAGILPSRPLQQPVHQLQAGVVFAVQHFDMLMNIECGGFQHVVQEALVKRAGLPIGQLLGGGQHIDQRPASGGPARQALPCAVLSSKGPPSDWRNSVRLPAASAASAQSVPAGVPESGHSGRCPPE
uniref:Predicted protein n=1 Tax=Physcomitrium patens TaxID=3218 RepID=A9U7K6_PHYPA